MVHSLIVSKHAQRTENTLVSDVIVVAKWTVPPTTRKNDNSWSHISPILIEYSNIHDVPLTTNRRQGGKQSNCTYSTYWTSYKSVCTTMQITLHCTTHRHLLECTTMSETNLPCLVRCVAWVNRGLRCLICQDLCMDKWFETS